MSHLTVVANDKNSGFGGYTLSNGAHITCSQDFFVDNCTCGGGAHAIMRCHATDLNDNDYKLSIHDDRLNQSDDNFELDMIDYDTPDVRML